MNNVNQKSSDDTTSTPPVALITGAGSGIGRACAMQLASAGYNLALVGRTQGTLQATAESCHAVNNQCHTMVLPDDICDPDSAGRLMAQVLKKWNRIDALFNVAGSAPLMPIEAITPQHWRSCIDSNLSGAVLLTAAAWPTFMRQQSGFVGNVSSMASIDPFPGFSMYAAAKVGLNMFTHCTAQEGKAINVNAVAVAPGAVETAMLRNLFGEEMIRKDQTLSPEDVAQVLCDCLQNKRAFKSGETILLDSPK